MTGYAVDGELFRPSIIFAAGHGNPLGAAAPVDPTESRLAVLRQFRSQPWGHWHHLMFGLIHELA